MSRCRWAIFAWQRKKDTTTFKCLMRDCFIHYDNRFVEAIHIPWRVWRVLYNTISGKYRRIDVMYHNTPARNNIELRG